MDSSHNPKFHFCGDLLAPCEFSQPDSDHELTDQVDGVLSVVDRQAGERESLIIECKQHVTFANPLTATGVYLAKLESSRFGLLKALKWQRAAFESALEQAQLVELAFLTDAPPAVLEGFLGHLRELRRKIAERFDAYLRTVFALRRVTRCLSGIRKIFFVALRPFRGLGWSKRHWCLLHGSHPPKASSPLAVVGVC